MAEKVPAPVDAASIPSDIASASASPSSSTVTAATTTTSFVYPVKIPSITDPHYPFARLQQKVYRVSARNDESELKWINHCQSNHIVVLDNCCNTLFVVRPNQRLFRLVLHNCTNVKVQITDSVVISTRTVRMIDCAGVELTIEDVDVRNVECWRTKNSKVVVVDSHPLVEESVAYWHSGCSNNKFQVASLNPGWVFPIAVTCVKEEAVPDVGDNNLCVTKVDEFDRITNTIHTITPASNAPTVDMILKEIAEIEAKPFNFTPAQLDAIYDKEREEIEEGDDAIKAKAKAVAAILRKAKHAVIYSGAGISTSANIPDFRGPQGVWTLRDKGEYVTRSKPSKPRPTYAHYAITELARKGFVKFVISTNMDSLHMRSGLPPHLICEQHGNAHKEICGRCKMVYYRKYDVTLSAGRDHETGRKCKFCNWPLLDTIVNFGENLAEIDAVLSLHHSRSSDLAIVLGTSMNVQPAASYPPQCHRNNGKLVVVNLQKTPYDDVCAERVFARTDNFMKALMEAMNMSKFDTTTDLLDQWDNTENPGYANEDGW